MLILTKPVFHSLPDMMAARVATVPDQTLFTWLADGEEPQEILTYAQFHRRAAAVATLLRERGQPGDRVLLLYLPSLEFVTAFFGCIYAGMVPVPSTPPDPARPGRSLPRLMAIVNDARTAHAMTSPELLMWGRPMIESIPVLQSMDWITRDQFADINPGDFQLPSPKPDDLAFLQYTSGSTAVPKGVCITHRNVLANLASLSHGFRSVPGDVLVSWVPQFHDLGLILGNIWPAFAQGQAVLMSPFDFLRQPLRWLKAITRFRGNVSAGPNFAYDLCSRRVTPEMLAELDLSSWRVAGNGAEPVRWQSLQDFARVFGPCGFRPEALVPGYGLAEAVLYVSCVPIDQHPVCFRARGAALEQNRLEEAAPDEPNARLIVGCGVPALGVDIRIVDPESRLRKGEGEIGEIWIAGDTVAQGYWRRPEETEQTFRARIAPNGEGPFLRTGDLGFFRNGELYICGRIKDVIIIRGANHYPQDIEGTVSAAHKALRPGCACAFSIAHDGEEKLVVVQEVRDEAAEQIARDAPAGRSSLAEEIVAAIRHAVADEHELQAWGVVLIAPRALPKTSSGKLQHAGCRDDFLHNRLETLYQDLLGEFAPAPPSTAGASFARRVREAQGARRQGIVEAYLRRELALILGIPADEIPAGASLLDMGLDSMQAMELIGDLEEDLGVTLDQKDLLERPSLLSIAAHLHAQLDQAAPKAPAREEIEEGAI